jgi:hypothetical protein
MAVGTISWSVERYGSAGFFEVRKDFPGSLHIDPCLSGISPCSRLENSLFGAFHFPVMIRRELGEISFHRAAFLDCVQPDFDWFPVFVRQTGNLFGESSSQQTASSSSQAGERGRLTSNLRSKIKSI